MRFDSGLLIHSGITQGYPPIAEWETTAKFMDSAGFTAVWCAEHHFFWDGLINPAPTNPILLSTYIIARTERLRVAQCGVCLPDWHPIRVAEDIAMVDHLSGGRVDLGVIRGLNGRVNGNFHPAADRRDQATSQALFWECLEVIQKAWTGEPFDHHGKFYTFPYPGWIDQSMPPENLDSRYYGPDGELKRLSVLPTPFQKPTPPIWVMADSPSSTAEAARRGLGVMSFAQSFEATRIAREAYLQATTKYSARDAPLSIMRPVYVARTEAEADAVMRPAINAMMSRGWRAANPNARRAYLAGHEELTEQDLAMEPYDFLRSRQQCFVGTPDMVVEQIKQYEAELGCQHLTLFWALPEIDFEPFMSSMRLFADEVMPAF